MIERVRQGFPDGLEELHTFVACIAERYACRQFGPQSCEDRVYDLYLLALEAVHDGGLHDPGRLMRFVRTTARYAWRGCPIGTSRRKVMPIMHVSDEDLENYFLGRLPPDRLSAVESHLTDCSCCTNRLSNVTGIFLKLLKLKNKHLGNYEGIEKRREPRVPFDSPGQIQSFSPFSREKFRVQMMDLSRNGLKVRSPQFVARGAMVQVIIAEAILLGEVRYCIPAEGEFDMGIQILDLIRKARG